MTVIELPPHKHVEEHVRVLSGALIITFPAVHIFSSLMNSMTNE